MMIVRKSTATTIIVGPVLDADGAAVTDAAVGDFLLSKNGGAPGSLNGSATLTHRHTGVYSLALTTSDLDTVGIACVTLSKTTDACATVTLQVIEQAAYDVLYAADAVGPAVAGDEMDLVDAPNATAVAAITAGLSTFDAITDEVMVGTLDADVITAIQTGLAPSDEDILETATLNAGNTGWITVDAPAAAMAIAGWYDGALLEITQTSTGHRQSRSIMSHFISSGDAGFNPDSPFSFSPVSGDTIKIFRTDRWAAHVLYWRGAQPAALSSSRVVTQVAAINNNAITAAAINAAALNGKGDWTTDSDLTTVALQVSEIHEMLPDNDFLAGTGDTTGHIQIDAATGDFDGKSFVEIVRIIAAALAGKSSGAGTGTIEFRGIDDTKVRISATTSSGNRTAVTLDGTVD